MNTSLTKYDYRVTMETHCTYFIPMMSFVKNYYYQCNTISIGRLYRLLITELRFYLGRLDTQLLRPLNAISSSVTVIMLFHDMPGRQ